MDTRHDAAVALRTLRGEAELPELVAIAQRSITADGVDWSITLDELANDVRYPEGWRPDRDVVVAEVEGAIAGWATPLVFRVGESGEPIVIHWGCVDPVWRRRGVGTSILRELHRRVAPLVQARGAGGGFGTHVDVRQVASIALLEGAGYVWRRSEFEMARPLDQAIEETPAPEGIEIRLPRPDEYRRVLEAADEAFADLPYAAPAGDDLREVRIERWLADRTFQPELTVVAFAGTEVVGSVRGFIDVAENEQFGRRRGYTERISVRRPWRKKGIASAMITRHLRLLREAGMAESGLGVDTNNPSGALPLYERLGFRRVGESRFYVKPVEP